MGRRFCSLAMVCSHPANVGNGNRPSPSSVRQQPTRHHAVGAREGGRIRNLGHNVHRRRQSRKRRLSVSTAKVVLLEGGSRFWKSREVLELQGECFTLPSSERFNGAWIQVAMQSQALDNPLKKTPGCFSLKRYTQRYTVEWPTVMPRSSDISARSQ